MYTSLSAFSWGKLLSWHLETVYAFCAYSYTGPPGTLQPEWLPEGLTQAYIVLKYHKTDIPMTQLKWSNISLLHNTFHKLYQNIN